MTPRVSLDRAKKLTELGIGVEVERWYVQRADGTWTEPLTAVSVDKFNGDFKDTAPAPTAEELQMSQEAKKLRISIMPQNTKNGKILVGWDNERHLREFEDCVDWQTATDFIAKIIEEHKKTS